MPKDTTPLPLKVMNEKMSVTEAGRKWSMTAEEVILRQLKTKAVRGDYKSSKYIIDLVTKLRNIENNKSELDYNLLSLEELEFLEEILEKASKKR